MQSHSVPSRVLDQFVAAAHRVAACGLVRCSSGNLSQRWEGDKLLIKASRAWMADLAARDIALCRLSDGASLDGRRPSVEIGFHAGILRSRPDVSVVLHFQSVAATTLACCREAPDFFIIPEIPYYIGPIAQVPYLPPGSAELAEAVTAAMRRDNLAMMANHGQVVAGTSFDDCLQKAMFFELACEILLRGGDRLRPLTPEAVAALRAG